MTYRILLSAGGTGGHVFPAMSLASELKSACDCSILFAAGKLSKNPHFESSSFSFKDISCSSSLIKGMGCNLKGVLESIKVIHEFNPDVVVGFGSYYTLPVLIAAKLLRKSLLLHEANSIPGRVNRLFAPFADKTWTFFPQAKMHLNGCVEECKMPLRSQFKKGIVTKEQALRYFNLEKQLPTVLVFGGSQGAKFMNALFSISVLEALKKQMPPFQIIHFTGSEEDAKVLNCRYSQLEIPSYVRSFEKRIDLAWAAADLAITRAGASSIAEQFEYEVPSLAIPFPNATDQHQDFNADFLVNTGLGLKVSEKGLTAQAFVESLLDLFKNRESALSKFIKYKKNNSINNFSDQVMKWIKENKQ